MARSLVLGVAVVAALWTSAASAQTPGGADDRYFYVGLSSGLGMELSGVKLFAGYKLGRGDIQLELYAGALALPPGPGAGIGLAGKYHLLDGERFRGALGGQLGVKLGAGVVPVAQIIGTGEARWGIASTYLQLKTGVPQIFGAGLGGKLSFARRTFWIEANTGLPLLLNGELGYSYPPFD